jgi:hypothetical protein
MARDGRAILLAVDEGGDLRPESVSGGGQVEQLAIHRHEPVPGDVATVVQYPSKRTHCVASLRVVADVARDDEVVLGGLVTVSERPHVVDLGTDRGVRDVAFVHLAM